MGLVMLCLAIGDMTLVQSLKRRKLGRSGYQLWKDTYIYEDKNTQKQVPKKKKREDTRRIFSQITFSFVSLKICAKIIQSLLLKCLVNKKTLKNY